MISYMDGVYTPNEQLSIPITDLGFMRSHTAYECVRHYNGHLFDIESHLERFYETMKTLGLICSPVDIIQICQSLIEKNRTPDGIFRIYQTSGIAGEGRLIILSQPLPIYLQTTSKVKTTPNFRTHPLVKATHYSHALKAIYDAKNEGFDEVIYLDEKKNLLELSYSNFFAIKDHFLITPKDGILPGVTRKHLLLIAPKVGLIPQERPLAYHEICFMDEVFHCNTTREVTPITQIDEIQFFFHAKTTLLHKALKSHIQLSLNSSKLKNWSFPS